MLYLASGLAKYERTIVIGLAGGELVDRAADMGLETVALSSDRGLGGVITLKRAIRSLEPRIVHAHASKAHQLARLAMLGNRLPLVVTRRVAFPLKRGPFARWKYVNGVAAYGAVSAAVKRQLITGGVSADRIAVIPDVADFQAIDDVHAADLTCLSLPDDAIIVLHAGALTAEKNHEMLFDVWANIKAQNASAHLLIAGEGQREQELKELASSMDLGGVHWLGFRSDIIALMKRAHLFLNTSRSEGLCSSLIQVRRCGVPIVATAVGGVPEVVEDGVSGFLVPSGDVDAMAEAACRVIMNQEMSILRSNISIDMERFTLPHMVAAYRALYRTL